MCSAKRFWGRRQGRMKRGDVDVDGLRPGTWRWARVSPRGTWTGGAGFRAPPAAGLRRRRGVFGGDGQAVFVRPRAHASNGRR